MKGLLKALVAAVVVLMGIGYLASRGSQGSGDSSNVVKPVSIAKTESPAPKKTRRPPDFDASPEMQKQRWESLKKSGAIVKVRVNGSIAHVLVKEHLFSANEKTYNAVLSIVYAWCVGSSDDFGVVDAFVSTLIVDLDNGSALGRKVGEYDPVHGFRRD
jgi:hypothetical protein